MGFLLIFGESLPEGSEPGWESTRIYSDLVQNNGWFVEGPYAELASWYPPGTMTDGQGECPPEFLVVTAPGLEWAALMEALDSGTDADVRTAAEALRTARTALYP